MLLNYHLDESSKRKSLWQIKVPQGCSWSWRKIMKMRESAKNFIQFKLGNGKDIYLWWDRWHFEWSVI